MRRRGGRVGLQEVRRRHEAGARGLPGADDDAREQVRCAMPSWPSAPTTKIPDVPADTPVREIQKIAVIGAGTMGGGIAMNFLNAGIPVVMLEMKQEALDKGVGHHPQELRSAGQEGQAQAGQVLDARMALLGTTLNYADLKDADMVIEAVFEDMGVKEKVFKTLDEVMKPGAILASNTSTLDLDRIAGIHPASAGRDRHPLLQPGQRDEAAGGGARREDGQGRAGHRDGAGQEDQEDLRGLGRVRRLHRQPHDRAVLAPGRLSADRGRRVAGAGGQGGREVRFRDGPVPHGRPGGQRHRLGHPQAALSGKAGHALQQDRRPAVRAGALRPEDGRRLVRLRAGQARCDSRARWSTR